MGRRVREHWGGDKNKDIPGGKEGWVETLWNVEEQLVEEHQIPDDRQAVQQIRWGGNDPENWWNKTQTTAKPRGRRPDH